MRKRARRRNVESQVRSSVQRCMADRDWCERLPGGTTRHPSEFEYESLVKGTLAELEHTTDPCIAMEIAMDHLDEDPHYYCKPMHRRKNPDACGSGCILAKHAWRSGDTSPEVRRAARDLADKRWTLSPREARIKASLLR